MKVQIIVELDVFDFPNRHPKDWGLEAMATQAFGDEVDTVVSVRLVVPSDVTAPSQGFIIWDNALGVQCGSGRWDNYFDAAEVCSEFNRLQPGGRWGVRHEDGTRVNVDVQMAREERES